MPKVGNAQIDEFIADYEIRADEGVYSLTDHDRWVIANFMVELSDEYPHISAPASAAAPQPQLFFQALVAYKNSDKTLADDQRFADAAFGAAPLLMDERLSQQILDTMYGCFHRGDSVERVHKAVMGLLGASPSPKLPEDNKAGHIPPFAEPASQQEASGEVLTDERIAAMFRALGVAGEPMPNTYKFARAIEAEVERRCRAQRTNNNKD